MGDANTPAAGQPLQSVRPPSLSVSGGEFKPATTGAIEPGSVHVIVGTTHARVVLSGEIDADLAADLAEATRDVQDSKLAVEIDAHHVTFMDSTGVAFLARLSAVTQEPVRIFNTPPTVRFLLEVTSIGSMLEIVEDTPGATGAPPRMLGHLRLTD